MVRDPANGHISTGPTPYVAPLQGSVGILSTSATGLQRVDCLLAQEAVAVSQAILVHPDDLRSGAGGSEMQAGLRVLQSDPSTEVVVLIAAEAAHDAAEQILAQVGESQKPTVVCFLGTDQRLLWKAGAIPAARLDEAALRAAAWVRGRDQALISSSLEEEDEELALRATGLRARIGAGRQLLTGFFVSAILLAEAKLMVIEVVGEASGHLWQVPDRETQIHRLRDACADPRVVIVLLDTHPIPETDLALSSEVANGLRRHSGDLLVITHIACNAEDPQYQAEAATIWRGSGAILASSNAAAARLAGMVLVGQKG
jgi:FdrA protein